VNEFGTLALAAPGDMLAQIGATSYVRAVVGDREVVARVARTFGDAAPGEPVILIDSQGRLCLALSQASLAERLGLARDSRPAVALSPFPDVSGSLKTEVQS
jgi:S-adenosylmethionine hydrolase